MNFRFAEQDTFFLLVVVAVAAALAKDQNGKKVLLFNFPESVL